MTHRPRTPHTRRRRLLVKIRDSAGRQRRRARNRAGRAAAREARDG